MPSVTLYPDKVTFPIQNIFCVGRNYQAHAEELGNRVEPTPVIFLKPTSAIQFEDQPICLPAWSNNIHFEAELVVLIGKGGKNIVENEALAHIAGYGLGIDLTARDVQNQVKSAGLPWTVAKGFDGSACLSQFIPAAQITSPLELVFTCYVNEVLRQSGKVTKMIFSLSFLIAYLSQIFTLQRGDLIFTGTPEGVGQLFPGDRLKLQLDDKIRANFVVQPN